MIQLISLAITITLFIVVIDFIRRGLLKEKYSVLWLVSLFAIAILSIWKGLLDKTAQIIGISYPPSLLFITMFIFVLLILLHYSVVISILTEKNKILAQEITLLKDAFAGRGENAKARKSD